MQPAAPPPCWPRVALRAWRPFFQRFVQQPEMCSGELAYPLLDAANRARPVRTSPAAVLLAWLTQQVEHALLGRVSLSQGRDAGLVQDGEAREIRDFGWDIRRADAVFRGRQVLHLVVDYVDGRLQAVNAGTDGAADTRDVGDGGINVRERRLGLRGGGQVIGADVGRGSTVGNRRGSKSSDGDADLAGGTGVRQEDRSGGRGEDRGSVERGGAADAVDFRLNLRELSIQSAALRTADGAGCGFRGQSNRTIQKRGDLSQSAIGDLQRVDTVARILRGLRECRFVGAQTVRDGQSGGVIRTGVDFGTGRETEKGLLQVLVSDGQLVLGHQRRNVIQDTECHVCEAPILNLLLFSRNLRLASGSLCARGWNPLGPSGSHFATEPPTYSQTLSAEWGKALVRLSA